MFGGSSNGRTTVFGAVHLGSNPSPPATRLWFDFAHHRLWSATHREHFMNLKSATPKESSVSSEVETNSFILYILRTSSNTLYIGQTNNLTRRLEEHRYKGSKSAKYVRFFHSFTLVYQENFVSRVEVMRREAQLKTWSRAKKEALVQGDKIALKKA